MDEKNDDQIYLYPKQKFNFDNKIELEYFRQRHKMLFLHMNIKYVGVTVQYLTLMR